MEVMRVELRVEVRDEEGKPVATRKCRGDLILDNFKELLAAILMPCMTLAAGANTTASLVTLAGEAVSTSIWANSAITSGQGLNFTGFQRSPDAEVGMWIMVGTSTVSPTRGDYKLGAEVARAIPSQTVGADYISWSVSIVLEAAADIAEAGLMGFIQRNFAASIVVDAILLFRDTFTPISVPAGGTISVTYTLTL